MALTLATADSALKEDYQPVVREQINNAILLLQQVEKNTRDIEGRRAVLSLHVQRSSGVGARGEGAALPQAANQGYAEERVPMKFNYGRIQLSGPVIRAMKSDRGSFVRAVQSETAGLTNDLKRDVNRQLFGTSDGSIALVAANAAVNIIVLQATTTVSQLRQLEVGMVVDIGSLANPTLDATARVITAVNFATPSITISGAAVTTTNGDSVFRSGAGGNAPQLELTGLRTIVAATGTLFNVSQTTFPTWASTVDSNGGTLRSVSENLFAKNMHNTFIAGGVDIDLWLTSDGVFRAYSNLLTSLKRFPQTLDLKGGFKGLDMSAGGYGGGVGVALAWDRDCPNNTAFGLSTPHLYEYQMSDWEWMQEDGAVLSRVPGFDLYEANLFKYHELTTDKRNAHCKISDLTEA